MTMDREERRKQVRKETDISANIIVAGKVYLCKIKNLSASGFYIETKVKVPSKTDISLSYLSPDNEKQIKKGQTVRGSEVGIGGKFEKLIQQDSVKDPESNSTL